LRVEVPIASSCCASACRAVAEDILQFCGWKAVVTVKHLSKGLGLPWIVTLAALCGAIVQAQRPVDPTSHTVQFITVDHSLGNDVKLEVLDWGGSGRPVVLLTGLGNNAHVYDTFATKLISAYHVYGITRRGYGASSSPAATRANYAADRLGDDVLAVIDALKLSKPVLVGHSLAGEELSSVGSRHPEKAAGLIYLDAAYSYAYSGGHLLGDPPPPSVTAEREPSIEQAIRAGMQDYTDIRVPILAIYAFPHDRGPEFLKDDPAARAAAEASEVESLRVLIKAFETGLPSARVVLLPHANHYVFRSNEADVLREMNAFIGSLP
jgi:non-heme chloroperoxidase